MQKIPIRKFIPGIIWFFVVLTLICLPKKDIPSLNGWGSFFEAIYLDKWVHAFMFGMLAYLFMMPIISWTFSLDRKMGLFKMIVVLNIVWGLMTECIQLKVPGRSFDLLDWAADSLGVFVAFYLSQRLLKTKQH